MSLSGVRYIHSCPAWIAGPRTIHPKFGGDEVVAGIPNIANRLGKIKAGFPNDYTSLHLLHELDSTTSAYASYNSRNAISWNDLVKGIRGGHYPKIAALTAPAFGLPCFRQGSILSPDPKVRQLGHDLHKEAIEKSRQLASQDLGLGVVLWWPAYDSEVFYHGTGRSVLRQEARKRMLDFWVSLIQEIGVQKNSDGSNWMVWLEWKPADPGDRDYIDTLPMAMEFCRQVNQAVGAQVMAVNNEWAHLLIGGTTVDEGTMATIKAGLFTGFLHANSALLSVVEYDHKFDRIENGAPGDDADWFAGAGGNDRWQDQMRAVYEIMVWAKREDKLVVFEHDINPRGDAPLEYYRKSRDNVEEMVQEACRIAA